MSAGKTLPRILWFLLAAAAALGVWLLAGEKAAAPSPLFGFRSADVVRIEIESDGRRHVLTYAGRSWRLGGSLVDHLDQDACTVLVTDLCGVQRSPGAVAHGADEADRLYGFDPEEPVVIALTDGEGRRRAVVVGDVNEVTDAVYVRDEGSDAIHLAQGVLGERIYAVPNGIRALELWPDVTVEHADTVRVVDGDGDELFFARDDDDLWWLREDGRIPSPGAAADYHRVASDRRRSARGVEWRLADGGALRNLLSLLDAARIREFEPWPPTAPIVAPPSRVGSVAVSVPGSGVRRVEVGETLPRGIRRVWRDGCPAGLLMQAGPTAYRDSLLRAPLAPYVFAPEPARADSLTLSLAGLPDLTAVPDADGRWRPRGADADGDFLDQLGDVVVSLGRLRLGEVLPPETDAEAVFHDAIRLEVVVYGRGAAGEPVRRWVLGVDAPGASVVAWRPADGFRCRVDNQLLVSARGLITGWNPTGR